jgi:hypothetical protein
MAEPRPRGFRTGAERIGPEEHPYHNIYEKGRKNRAKTLKLRHLLNCCIFVAQFQTLGLTVEIIPAAREECWSGARSRLGIEEFLELVGLAVPVLGGEHRPGKVRSAGGTKRFSVRPCEK